MPVSMLQDPFYPYSLLFSSYCIHNYHILFVYIYATSPVSSSSTSSSLNAEEQSGTPSTSTMENNLQATYGTAQFKLDTCTRVSL